MIHDRQELAASVNYALRWADTLEGLRQQAQETDATLLPTTAAGPLSEIRRVLAETRAFLEMLPQPPDLSHDFSVEECHERAAGKTSA